MTSTNTNNNNNNNNHNNTDDTTSHHDHNNKDKKDPFILIEKGYACQHVSPWNAAYYFLQASKVLHSKARLLVREQQQLQLQLQQETEMDPPLPKQITSKDYKTRKIAALYEDQGNIYLHEARKALVDAMEKELEEDQKLAESIPSRVQVIKYLAGEEQQQQEEQQLQEQQGSLDGDSNKNNKTGVLMEVKDDDRFWMDFQPKMNFLTSDEIQMRKEVFETLFVSFSSFNNCKDEEDDNDAAVTTTATATATAAEKQNDLQQTTNADHCHDSNVDKDYNDTTTTTTNTIAQELSLEERLALLNASMGSTVPKSDEERWKDLQTSLNGLGVYVPDTTASQKDHVKEILYGGIPMSEDEQVDEIINMAKDEASLSLKQNGEDATTCASRDVLKLIQNSSIRLDLSADSDGNPEDMAFDPTVANNDTTDAEMNFWKTLKIENEDVRAESPKCKMDQMKEYLDVAQQLLLQASVCMEELKEQGYCMDDDMELKMVDGDDIHGDGIKGLVDTENDSACSGPSAHGFVDTENPKCEHQEDRSVECDMESTKNKGKVGVVGGPTNLNSALVPQKEEVQKGSPETSGHGNISSLVHMGKSGLDEAFDLVQKVRSMWNVNVVEKKS